MFVFSPLTVSQRSRVPKKICETFSLSPGLELALCSPSPVTPKPVSRSVDLRTVMEPQTLLGEGGFEAQRHASLARLEWAGGLLLFFILLSLFLHCQCYLYLSAKVIGRAR